jgi:hypothetical protein
MGDTEPKRVFLGSYEGGATAVIVPAAALERANEVFDRERRKREAIEAKAKLQVMQAARGTSRLRKALKLMFGRGR